MEQISKIIVGVSGGIAAYKSADLVRRLREAEFAVRVVMSRAACRFITPLTLQALSGHPVHHDLFDEAAEAAMGHIELARWADMVLVAPATADCMAKLANGFADDLLSTLCLATRARLVLAPAMNRQMWAAPATCANRATLRGRGVWLLGPARGAQACGEIGPGRMLEPEEIVSRIRSIGGFGRLSRVSVLVTAGPTREAMDPVRFISNPSTGRMGYALAQAAAEAGARVTLVSGPTELESPSGVDTICVQSAEEMYHDVMKHVPGHDILIGAAAVADYRPVEVHAQKMKKAAGRLVIDLERTRDILADVSRLAKRPFTVGFAAETENLERNAIEKLERKSLDMIAANVVGQRDTGFAAPDNALHIYWRGGQTLLPRTTKVELARALIEIVADRYDAQNPAQDSR